MSDLEEAFLKANANLDYIAHEFAEVLRNLMRASVAQDPTRAVYRAAEQMNYVAKLLARTDEKFGWGTLFAKAVEHVQVEPTRDEIDDAVVAAAQSGVKFLVERSCADNAARGRSSRRQQEFFEDIRRIEEARDRARRDWTRR